MPDRPDPDRCLAALEPADRETIARWSETLGGLEWTDVPPLRQLVEMLAVLLTSADSPEGDAIRRAAEELGLEDDDRRSTHPADRYGRQLRRWHGDARGRGQNVRSHDEEAA